VSNALPFERKVFESRETAAVHVLITIALRASRDIAVLICSGRRDPSFAPPYFFLQLATLLSELITLIIAEKLCHLQDISV
jgi:hypothetical protein